MGDYFITDGFTCTRKGPAQGPFYQLSVLWHQIFYFTIKEILYDGINIKRIHFAGQIAQKYRAAKVTLFMINT
jgi:hypothetical protein